MPVVDIYGTLTNVANKILFERERYLALERTETSGIVVAGDESVTVPAVQLTQIKAKLTNDRIIVYKS